MFIEAGLAVLSLVVAGSVAATQIWRWWKDKDSARKAEILTDAHAAENRDTIIVGSAERALGVLERTLTNVNNDAEALRRRVRELEATVASQNARIAAQDNEIHTMRMTVAALERKLP